jgi:rhodanese-related sulfurtransferase
MTVPELAPLQVKHRLDAGEPLRILDVREPWERAIVSLPGSVNIPMGEIPARCVSSTPKRRSSCCARPGAAAGASRSFCLPRACLAWPICRAASTHGRVTSTRAWRRIEPA